MHIGNSPELPELQVLEALAYAKLFPALRNLLDLANQKCSVDLLSVLLEKRGDLVKNNAQTGSYSYVLQKIKDPKIYY